MKRYFLYLCITGLAVIICFTRCNNHSVRDVETTTIDSTAPSSQDTMPYQNDSIAPVTMGQDTNARLVPPPLQINEPGRSATLGYSYYPHMKRGETKDVNVYISVRHPGSRVIDTLKVIVAEQNDPPQNKNDTTVIDTINVIFYKAIEVSLIDPAKDFEVVQIHNSNLQEIDTEAGNKWRWTITTNTDKPKAKLILKVVATKPNGITSRFNDKTISINIQLDRRTAWRKLIDYLYDNPAVSVPILVGFFGFIGYLIKYWLGRKKINNEADKKL
jgi:hypothetical protein